MTAPLVASAPPPPADPPAPLSDVETAALIALRRFREGARLVIGRGFSRAALVLPCGRLVGAVPASAVPGMLARGWIEPISQGEVVATFRGSVSAPRALRSLLRAQAEHARHVSAARAARKGAAQ